ncbi:MAG: S8 family serine peptidase [Saprospiraceae bacterium]
MKKLILCFCLIYSSLYAQDSDHRNGQLLVQLDYKANVDELIDAVKGKDGEKAISGYEILDRDLGFYRLYFNAAAHNEHNLLEQISGMKSVGLAQFNHIVSPRSLSPNDTHWDKQWDLRKIWVDQVWDRTTGGLSANGDTIVVAVVEVGGYVLNHPDIVPNIYINHGEIPADGLDNDGNGYIDDINGWNATSNSGNLSGDTGNHGTSVMGIIGAKGNNNTGVSGINWYVKMMLFSNTDDEATSIKAYAYILKMRDLYNKTNGKKGAFVVALNYSAGIDDATPSQAPLWCKMFDELGKVGVLSVVATSNSTNKNIEILGDIPTQCPSTHLIGVTNTSRTDEILGACGVVSVDLSAPGGTDAGSTPSFLQGSYTTRQLSYSEFAGTSAATPHVSGTIALLYSFPNTSFASAAIQKPAETALFIKDAILKNVDKFDRLSTCVATGGRLNAFSSYQFLERAINETRVDSIAIRPNPVKDKLEIVIQTNGGAKPVELFLYNSIGQLVVQPELNAQLFEARYKIELDLSAYARGVYFLAIRNNKGKLDAKRILLW